MGKTVSPLHLGLFLQSSVNPLFLPSRALFCFTGELSCCCLCPCPCLHFNPCCPSSAEFLSPVGSLNHFLLPGSRVSLRLSATTICSRWLRTSPARNVETKKMQNMGLKGAGQRHHHNKTVWQWQHLQRLRRMADGGQEKPGVVGQNTSLLSVHWTFCVVLTTGCLVLCRFLVGF